jgi:hypothetical protein
MFTIRKEQVAVLSKVEARTIESRQLSHIRETYPKKVDALGEDKIREIIRDAPKRATKYGFKGDPHVLKYVEVMVLWGRDFDADPQLPWAAQILRKRKKPAVKLSTLYEEAIKRWKDSQNLAAG